MQKHSITMLPAPGTNQVRYVGDTVRFELHPPSREAVKSEYRAFLRTNLGRAAVLRDEIVQAHSEGVSAAGASMHDIPMPRDGEGWAVALGLAETGFFRAKAYLVDAQGWQHWPQGPDVGLSVHPDDTRTANTIYCAFVRMFGPTKSQAASANPQIAAQVSALDEQGFTVIPPSGTFRDLIRELPHIVDKLGCRILHLLPVNPVPTTYARFGRFGSPYAALDLAGVDPALVEFDRRTTGVDQFKELTAATHDLGARVFLDIVINHTGWGSTFQDQHPEWFLRNDDGSFKSPGAWGNTWEDLVELRHRNVALWDTIAESLLTWCRRGVDGFRCDAGYMVPVPAWQYIIARVQSEFSGVIFLLEGLGGAWEATEALLTFGGMQWAYSELFQNYDGTQVSGYLSHVLQQNQGPGLLVHYSETHDNDRLAVRGRAWSLLRNRLCALASLNGAFGFTCGVEWLASEKVNVHSSRALAWGRADNIIPELAQLNRLLADHPCFFDGATVSRLSPDGSPVLVLMRESASREDLLLIVVNLDPDHSQALTLSAASLPPPLRSRLKSMKLTKWHDLLGQARPERAAWNGKDLQLSLTAASAVCLAPERTPVGLSGQAYRQKRARAAWGMQALCTTAKMEASGQLTWHWLADQVDRSPVAFLAAVSQLNRLDQKRRSQPITERELGTGIESASAGQVYPPVIVWKRGDVGRVTPVPSGHWLLVQGDSPFRATLELPGDGARARQVHLRSIPAAGQHIAVLEPTEHHGPGTCQLRERGDAGDGIQASLLFLPAAAPAVDPDPRDLQDGLVLLTNGRGGMARICVDLGQVRSKYDCLLGANLHPHLPVDRHVFAKRLRAWVNADGFLSPLDRSNLSRFEMGPPARWHFAAHAGDGRACHIVLEAAMRPEENTTVLRFSRPVDADSDEGRLPKDADVRLTLRVDIEDRNFHSETQRNGGAEHHFESNLSVLKGSVGFRFKPAKDRQFGAWCDHGKYHPAPEWTQHLPHPIEQSRGQTGCGDAYSPGWFEVPLPAGATTTLRLSAEPDAIGKGQRQPKASGDPARETSPLFAPEDRFGQQLIRAAQAFVVRRDDGKTVIAGYPWFLDWGRDSLIAARGLLAGGFAQEVRDLAIVFARFEERGTLPNTIHGSDASNRDTSDAPMWFGVVCEELAEVFGAKFYSTSTGSRRRKIRDVLIDIATHYSRGTPNGIRMDPESALIWSPSHFTWMDTNYPAGTPREGYPVEIQALWIRFLRQLATLTEGREQDHWGGLAQQAADSLQQRFWSEHSGWYADVLLAGHGVPAAQATRDDALRSNCLAVVAFGLADPDRAKRTVQAAQSHLVVPGALRSLAPLPVNVPLPIHANDGGLLNDPSRPYWGRYEGDEDTRRKPAYHNGTGWTWTFPIFCEALAVAWGYDGSAVRAARGYLSSMADLLRRGCLGQIPEVVDGDAPHAQRGCDAQAWGVTEALRVWRRLQEKSLSA